MLIACIGDLHILSRNPVSRLDNLPETQELKVDEIIDICIKNKVRVLVSTGDIFDFPHQGYNTFIKYYFKFKRLKDKGIEFITVYGQHDLFFHQLSSADSTALGAMRKLGIVSIADRDPIMINDKKKVVNIYGTSHGEEIPELSGRVKDVIHMLLIHKMIAPKAPWPYAKEGKDFLWPSRIYDREHWFDFTLCGDWHGEFCWRSRGNTWIVNPGAVIRKTSGVEDYNRHPKMILWNTTDNVIDEIKLESALPSKKVLSREHLDSLVKSTRKVKDFIERVKSGSSSLGPAYILNLLKKLKEMEDSGDVSESVLQKIRETINYSSYKSLLNQELQHGERREIKTKARKTPRKTIKVRIKHSSIKGRV